MLITNIGEATETVTPEVLVAPTPQRAWLTVERLLYGLLLLVAAGVRLVALTLQPLNTLEVTNAWQAWLVATAHQGPATTSPNSPLLYSLYTLSFWASDAGDVTVRLLPAICGIALLFVLWYWRDWLGRSTMLVVALLVAVDPWLVAYSRLGDSVMLTLLLGMLVLTALQRISRAPDTQGQGAWPTVLAISAGLLLVSGPQFWSFGVVVLLFVWCCIPAERWLPLVRQPNFLIWFAGAAIAGGTGWLLHPEALGALSTGLTTWLHQLIPGDGLVTYPLSWLLLRLIVDQPLLLCFGVVGLWLLWRAAAAPAMATQPAGWPTFLTVWLMWGIFLNLAPGRSPLTLMMLGLPLLLAAGHALGQLLETWQYDIAWRENGVLMLVVAVLFLAFCFWLAALVSSALFDAALARTLVVILALMLAIILAYTLWLDGRQARVTAGALLAVYLLLWTISSSWQLNVRFDLAYPDGFFATYTNPDVRQLAADVQSLSAQRHGDAGEMPLQVQMVETPDPVLAWYLRPMRNLTWVLAPGMAEGQSPPAIITLSAADQESVQGLSSAYLGSRYLLRDHWLPESFFAVDITPPVVNADDGLWTRLEARLNARWTTRTQNLLRWMIYRKAPAIPPSDGVVLWVATVDGQE
ncbi:MAG: hypothetical protein R3C14_44220 [Caldilineaceae bacterium]